MRRGQRACAGGESWQRAGGIKVVAARVLHVPLCVSSSVSVVASNVLGARGRVALRTQASGHESRDWRVARALRGGCARVELGAVWLAPHAVIGTMPALPAYPRCRIPAVAYPWARVGVSLRLRVCLGKGIRQRVFASACLCVCVRVSVWEGGKAGLPVITSPNSWPSVRPYLPSQSNV